MSPEPVIRQTILISCLALMGRPLVGKSKAQSSAFGVVPRTSGSFVEIGEGGWHFVGGVKGSKLAWRGVGVAVGAALEGAGVVLVEKVLPDEQAERQSMSRARMRPHMRNLR